MRNDRAWSGGVGERAGWIIRALHVAFVAFVALAPFSRNARALALHYVMVPLLWAHWATNDDSCALTLLETKVRGVETDRSFFHALVGPVYRVSDASLRTACWVASAALWAITASKVSPRDVLGVMGETFTGVTTTR